MDVPVFDRERQQIGVRRGDRIVLQGSSEEWRIVEGNVYASARDEDFIGQVHGDAITSFTGECLYTFNDP